MGLAYIRTQINLTPSSQTAKSSHLFWRAALASVRFVRKVFWEGCKQADISDLRTDSRS